MSKLYTLIFPIRQNRVLLGHKTRGIGANFLNGFGGKIDAGETLLEGAKRELFEECGLSAKLHHVGIVIYSRIHIVHIYLTKEIYGDPKESEEMCPIGWFDLHDIPYERMLPDKKVWMPRLFQAGTASNGYFMAHFGPGYKTHEEIVFDSYEGLMDAYEKWKKTVDEDGDIKLTLKNFKNV